MTKRFDFGTKNLNGNLIPAPFDGKSLRIDWLSDFMFEGCVVHNRQYCEEHLGFIQLYREVVGCVLELSLVDNWLRYRFIAQTLRKDDIKCICKYVQDFFDSENLTIEMLATETEEGLYDNEVIFYFYFRDEEK